VAFIIRSQPRRGLRLAVAGAVLLTALTAATATAAPPSPMGGQAPAMSRLGASPSQDPSVSSPPPGFLLERGRFTPVAIPRRLEATAPWGIAPTGINDRRQIVGEYIDDRLISRGFLIDQDGRYTRIDVPGSLATNAAKINNRGQIVGVYSDTSRDLGDRPDSDPTAPTYKLRGFLRDQRGRFTRLDFPGARSSQASGINDRGQILFIYGDDRSPLRGAVLSKGVFTRFDAQGAQITFPFGLHDRGQIVGYSVSDPADLTTVRGFLLAEGAKGPFTTISRPGATVTVPTGINNRGQIVGIAFNPEATPSPQPTGTAPMGRTA
jgi:hypothetical protein